MKLRKARGKQFGYTNLDFRSRVKNPKYNYEKP